MPGAIVTHSGHDYRHRLCSEFFGHAAKQDIGRRTVSIGPWVHRLSTATFPSGRLLTLRCRFPGQISDSSCRATGRRTAPPLPGPSKFHRAACANISVKPSGMCCTTRMLAGKSGGQLRKQILQRFGPPVEMPMATTRVGAEAALLVSALLLKSLLCRRSIASNALALRGGFDFADQFCAISGMRAATSTGFATKSNAPSPSALT